MKNFEDIDFPLSRTYYSNRLQSLHPLDFYLSAIPNSKSISLLLGYFTTNSIRLLSYSFASFIKNGGVLEIIANHVMSEKDREVLLEENYEFKNVEIFKSQLDNVLGLAYLFEESAEHFYDCLRYLLENGKLKFISIIGAEEELVHYKNGLYIDNFENQILTFGSSNFTLHGLTDNIENIEVNPSWENIDVTKHKIDEFKDEFYSILKKEKTGIKYLDADSISEYIRSKGRDKELDELLDTERRARRKLKLNDRLKQKLSKENNRDLFITNEIAVLPNIPSGYLEQNNGKLFRHQESAIKSWFKNNNCQGIFNMATGSGKTVTALACITRLILNPKFINQHVLIVIVAPYLHLIKQWEKECTKFHYKTICCYGKSADWTKRVEIDINSLNRKRIKYLCLIVTNKTFLSDKFTSRINLSGINFCLIADEMHNLGSPSIRQKLKLLNPNLRIGLSATPERHLDLEGTSFLKNYFGDEVINYGIKDAIKDKALTPYYYYPIIINLTESEQQDYIDLSIRIAQCFARGNSSENDLNEEKLKILLLTRSRLIANADNKLLRLLEIIKERRNSKYNLIYCGDEIQFEDEFNNPKEVSESVQILTKQVDKIKKILGLEYGMHLDKITAEESLAKREDILRRFSEGDLQAIVAIRCLDEGVDVKRTETAYILASSSNPRQYIQRRGRVLRKCEGKDSAKIYDFIVLPSIDLEDRYYNIHRKLMEKELSRIVEFASVAINKGEANELLLPYKKKYNLLNI